MRCCAHGCAISAPRAANPGLDPTACQIDRTQPSIRSGPRAYEYSRLARAAPRPRARARAAPPPPPIRVQSWQASIARYISPAEASRYIGRQGAVVEARARTEGSSAPSGSASQALRGPSGAWY
jgi:hypothetical protein